MRITNFTLSKNASFRVTKEDLLIDQNNIVECAKVINRWLRHDHDFIRFDFTKQKNDNEGVMPFFSVYIQKSRSIPALKGMLLFKLYYGINAINQERIPVREGCAVGYIAEEHSFYGVFLDSVNKEEKEENTTFLKQTIQTYGNLFINMIGRSVHYGTKVSKSEINDFELNKPECRIQ